MTFSRSQVSRVKVTVMGLQTFITGLQTFQVYPLALLVVAILKAEQNAESMKELI